MMCLFNLLPVMTELLILRGLNQFSNLLLELNKLEMSLVLKIWIVVVWSVLCDLSLLCSL